MAMYGPETDDPSDFEAYCSQRKYEACKDLERKISPIILANKNGNEVKFMNLLCYAIDDWHPDALDWQEELEITELEIAAYQDQDEWFEKLIRKELEDLANDVDF